MSVVSIASKKRKLRVRNKIKKKNKSSRAKISVFRSNKNIYVQLIDVGGNVLHSLSSVTPKIKLNDLSGIEVAKLVGGEFGKACVDNGITDVVFDKGLYTYGGRVKALADSCREAGLKF